jgi:hypothetical protein
MTALLAPSAAPASLSDSFLDEPLFQMQIRVARRADELARQATTDREADMRAWHQAEREVLEADESAQKTPAKSAA